MQDLMLALAGTTQSANNVIEVEVPHCIRCVEEMHAPPFISVASHDYNNASLLTLIVALHRPFLLIIVATKSISHHAL